MRAFAAPPPAPVLSGSQPVGQKLLSCMPARLCEQVSAPTVDTGPVGALAATQLSLLPVITPRACFAILSLLPPAATPSSSPRAMARRGEFLKGRDGYEKRGGANVSEIDRGCAEIILGSADRVGLFMTLQGLPSARPVVYWSYQPNLITTTGSYIVALAGEMLQVRAPHQSFHQICFTLRFALLPRSSRMFARGQVHCICTGLGKSIQEMQLQDEVAAVGPVRAIVTTRDGSVLVGGVQSVSRLRPLSLPSVVRQLLGTGEVRTASALLLESVGTGQLAQSAAAARFLSVRTPMDSGFEMGAAVANLAPSASGGWAADGESMSLELEVGIALLQVKHA